MADKTATKPTQEEEVKEPTNVVPLKLAWNNGEEDPNWLKHMPIGSHFLTRPKATAENKFRKSVGAGAYHVVHKTDRCVLLVDNLQPPHEPTYMWVVSADFSAAHEKLDVLSSGPIQVLAEAPIEDKEDKEEDLNG